MDYWIPILKDSMRGLIILLTLLLVQPIRANSQSAYRNITREQGLAGESVNKIIIDHRGIVWLATSNGVNIFDGIRPVTVPIDDDGADGHFVFDICEDPQHNFFISMSTGLYRLRKGDAAFQRVALLEGKTTLLSVDSMLYLISRDNVQTFDGQKLRPTGIASGSKGQAIRSLASDGKGTLWLLTDNDLRRFDHGRFAERYDLAGLHQPGTPLSQVMACGSRLYIATKGAGLFVYDPVTRQADHVEGIGNIVNMLADGGNGRLCVATDGAGAYLLDTHTGEIESRLTARRGGELPTDAVYCYLHDERTGHWLGLSRYGLAYSCRPDQLVKTYGFKEFSTEGMDVRSFCVYESDHLIGTYDGLYFIREQSGLVRHITPEQLGGGHIVTDIVRFAGSYFIGTFDGGLWQLDPGSLSLTRIGAARGGAFISVSMLRVSPDNRLWVSGSDGVCVIDSDGTITRFDPKSPWVKNTSVSSFLFNKHGDTWVCGNQGIAVYDHAKRQFTDYPFPEGFFNDEGYLRACMGQDSVMYFGSKGVYYTDADMTRYGKLPLSGKLQEESIGDLLADHRGNLWMATEKGLFRLIGNSKTIQHIGYSEGVRSRMIGRGSLRVSSKDNLWFATAEGLQWLSLADLKDWAADSSRVWLNEITVGDHPLSSTEILETNEERRLGLSWTFGAEPLRVKAVLQDYARPEGRFFEYRLSDDQEWAVAEAGEEIIFDGLSLGRHQLEVRLMGLERTTTKYTISVYPSKTTWSVGALVAFSALLLLLLRRERRSSHELRDERNLVEEALIETEQELEEVRNEEVTSKEVTGDEAVPQKYQRMRMSDEESADIVSRMRSWLESSRAYTNPDLKRSDIADELKVPQAKLSQVFTLYLNENYYDFVNQYRLAEFKRLLADGAYKRFTLTALSEQCGFKKSSFFSTFRKQEGMTPTEYLKQQNIKMKI